MTALRSVRIDDERWVCYGRAAEAAGVDRSAWIRRVCDEAAEKELAEGVRAGDAKVARERLRQVMAGLCPHGLPPGVCLRPECKGGS